MRLTRSEKVFSVINTALLIVIAVLFIYPIWYIFISAVSNPVAMSQAVSSKAFILLPQKIDFKYLNEHFQNRDIWRSYLNTFHYTIVGSLISMFLTVTCSFVLSRKNVPGLKFMTILVILTMWLKPGMIATYLNIENLGLMKAPVGILLPFAFSAFNVILLKNSFESVPKDIDESAQIDGASHFRVLFNIYLPSNVPAITTVWLFYIIDRWNGYFWAELVLQKDKLYPLQVLVKKILSNGGDSGMLFEGMVSAYALIVIAIVPMLILFPFIQKYFKKGVMVGSVK